MAERGRPWQCPSCGLGPSCGLSLSDSPAVTAEHIQPLRGGSLSATCGHRCASCVPGTASFLHSFRAGMADRGRLRYQAAVAAIEQYGWQAIHGDAKDSSCEWVVNQWHVNGWSMMG